MRKRYIIATALCALFIAAAIIFIAPTESAYGDTEKTAAETETPQLSREIARKPRKIKEVSLPTKDEDMTVTDATKDDASETTVIVDYSSFVDADAWAAEISEITKTFKGEWNRYETAFDKQQAAAVVWAILWRVDDTKWNYFPDNITGVIKQPNQFTGYHEDNWEDPALREIAVDVLGRYLDYKGGASLEDVGCVLPPEYMWFRGGYVDGIRQNIFRDAYDGDCDTWDWSWANPYEEGAE